MQRVGVAACLCCSSAPHAGRAARTAICGVYGLCVAPLPSSAGNPLGTVWSTGYRKCSTMGMESEQSVYEHIVGGEEGSVLSGDASRAERSRYSTQNVAGRGEHE